MANRRFHYEAAFEHFLRANELAYVSVDEKRRPLYEGRRLKNFDFVVYGNCDRHLLVDVKGRKFNGGSRGSLQNWVTRTDVADMLQWQQLFGGQFDSVFAFLFWCTDQPPDALFIDTFAFDDRWYAMLSIAVGDYASAMTRRSSKWQTVQLPADRFESLSGPITERLIAPADVFSLIR